MMPLIPTLLALAGAMPARATTVEVVDYAEKTIYHSPETPGYTSWVGLWQMPDGALRCCFSQVLGTGDKQTSSVPVIESKDAGDTWTRLPQDLAAGSVRGMAMLKDGTWVRPVWTGDPNSAGYTQRSTDAGATWEAPVHFVSPADHRAWPTVIRPLRDGRLVLNAGVWKRGDGTVPNPRMTKMVFISTDEGRSWGQPIPLMATEEGVCEESDWCELPSGDLFFIHRVEHFPASPEAIPPGAARMGEPFPNGYSDRMQSVVYRWRDTLKPGPATHAPFPHSGFPEVMLTQEDLILHFATDGIYWTDDIGKTWTRLQIPGSSYYPRAVQLKDGKIVCIGHVGSDDVPGTVDQSIRMQTFRLRVGR